MPAAGGGRALTRLGAVALGLLLAQVQPATAQDAPVHEERERNVAAMGTELVIKVQGPAPKVLEEALDAAEAELRRVEDVFTSWRPSPLTRLNAGAGKGPFRVDREQARLIARALEVGRISGGAFDITFASAGRLWDLKRSPPKIPDAAEIEAAVAKIDYRRVEVDVEGETVTLPAGTQIGLGGIAKGYGVDRAMAVLMKRGIEHAMVNAGGDLKALGRDHGETWTVAIRHPRRRGEVLAVIPVSNTCVVTSGDYERFFEHEGKRYHHILDPRTGRPSQGCMSATVVAPEAAFADGLATALCVLTPEKGLALVARLERVEALVVGMDGAVHVSAGLQRTSEAKRQR